jgi:hypothetical protein
MTGPRTALARLARVTGELMEQAAPAVVRVTVEMANVPRDVVEHYGHLSTRVDPDGTATDYRRIQVGTLEILMSCPPRAATDVERMAIRLKLVDAAVSEEVRQ